MRKNKLLLLLALLLTAATGAWATDVYLVGNGTGNWVNGVIWDPGASGNKMTEQNGVYSITFTNVDANSDLQFKFAINGNWAVTYGCTSTDANELNKTLSNIDATGGMNFMFGLTEKADVTISFNLSEMTYMISTKGMKVGDDASSAPKHLITATYREQTRSLEQPLPYATSIGELYEAVSGQSFSDLISSMSSVGMPLTGITSRNTSIVSIGEFNGASTPVTVIADGEATISIKFGSYALGIFVSAISPLYAYMKDGVKDADKWTVKVGEGQAQALPIGGLKGDGKETVTLQYNGRRKVKGVKATSEAPAKEPATVTTAPTGAAIVGVGKTTALVSGGAAEGGTLMYAVTTENTKPASTDGFSDAVPTAQGITASGKVYVWYYVKGDDTHSDSEIAATAIEVPVADIVWDATNVSDLCVFEGAPYEMEGVTMSSNAGNVFATWTDDEDPTKVGIEFEAYETGGYTFTAPAGKAFTKIEMIALGNDGWDTVNLGTGWAFNNSTVTWKGTAAASTVELLTDDGFVGEPVKCIVFYLSE